MAPPLSEAQGLLLMMLMAAVSHLAAGTRSAVRQAALDVLAATGDFVALSSVPLALGAVASGGMRAVFVALASPQSRKRRVTNALATASLLIGFVVLVTTEDPESAAGARDRSNTSADVYRRFSSLGVLSHLLLSLLAMVGALSWIADTKDTTTPASQPRDAEVTRCAFAALAGGAGACALVFKKSIAELAYAEEDTNDAARPRVLSLASLLLLAWTLLALFANWWRRSSLPSDAQSPSDVEPVVLKTYFATWTLCGVLQGTAIFQELRSASLLRSLGICIGVAAVALGLLTLKYRPRSPRLKLFDGDLALSIEATALLAATERLLTSESSELEAPAKEEKDARTARDASVSGSMPAYRPPILYKTL